MYLYWTLYSTYIRDKINVQSKKLGKHHGYVKNNLMNSWESRECHIKKKLFSLDLTWGEVLFEIFEGISNIPSAACHNKSSLFSKSPCFTLKTTICGQNISTNIYNLLTLTKRSIKIIKLYFFFNISIRFKCWIPKLP